MDCCQGATPYDRASEGALSVDGGESKGIEYKIRTFSKYQVSKIVKEIGSGVNDNRPKFLALLADPSIGRIVIEHQDRGTRFGFRSIETLLKTSGREIEVVNQAEHSTEDLLADLTSIV